MSLPFDRNNCNGTYLNEGGSRENGYFYYVWRALWAHKIRCMKPSTHGERIHSPIKIVFYYYCIALHLYVFYHCTPLNLKWECVCVSASASMLAAILGLMDFVARNNTQMHAFNDHIHLQLDTRSRRTRFAISWVHFVHTNFMAPVPRNKQEKWANFSVNAKNNKCKNDLLSFACITATATATAKMGKNKGNRQRFYFFVLTMPSWVRSTMFQWFVLNIVNPNNGILFAFSVCCWCFYISRLFKFNWANLHNENVWDSHFHGELLANKNGHIINWLNKIHSKSLECFELAYGVLNCFCCRFCYSIFFSFVPPTIDSTVMSTVN